MNQVFLIGRVGQDPEIREFSDSKIANISFATTERGYKLENGTEVPEHTDWHSLRIRGGLVNIVEKYVHKGDRLAINGRILYRSYEKDGKKVYVTEIVVNDLEMLSEKKSDAPQQARAPKSSADDNLPF